MLFMINSFGHYVHFGRYKGCFVSGILGMPKTLPETSMPETLPTLPALHLMYRVSYSYVRVYIRLMLQSCTCNVIWWSYKHKHSFTMHREKQSHDFNWFPERAMYYVLKRCKIGLLHKQLCIFSKFCMIDFKIYSFGHFGHFGRPKPSYVPGLSGMPETSMPEI